MIVNKPCTNKEYADLATYCNENGMIIADRGNYLESVYPTEIPPTEEQQREARALAYQAEVDPITCHISRLQDEEPTEETLAEIEKLKQEREDKVEEIKARYPYPVNNLVEEGE